MRHLRNQIVGQNNTQNVDIDITKHKLQLIGLLYYYRYNAFHNATRTYAGSEYVHGAFKRDEWQQYIELSNTKLNI